MEPTAKTPEAIVRLLASLDAFWGHWGFAPWGWGALAGDSRAQRFVKGGAFGPVAEYRAWDCIVWESGGVREREALWEALKPMPEVMTQRFVFLLDPPWTKRRIRSFALGFRGYTEFYAYWPLDGHGTAPDGAKDLTDLIDMGIRLSAAAKGDSGSR